MRMNEALELLHQWKKSYHTNREGDLVFQNTELYSNVMLTDNAVHGITDLDGFEQLPAAIENPDSVWSYWENPKLQLVTLRNYIKGGYVVQTRDGLIKQAFLTGNINKYKKGVLL